MRNHFPATSFCGMKVSWHGYETKKTSLIPTQTRKVGLSYMRAYEEKELLKRIYHNQGLEEGLEEGRRQQMISVIMQQMNRGKSTSQIADFLDMDVAEVQRVYDVGKKYAPDYDLDAIYKELYS